MAEHAPWEHPACQVMPWDNQRGQGCSLGHAQCGPTGGRDVPIALCCLVCLSDWEKPNCPALLTSPGDEREATNSFAELLRYLISSNCSWEDRGKGRDSAADGGKGKRMVEMGRKKGLEGTDGNPWDSVGACVKKERGRKGQQRNDGCKQQKKGRTRQTKNWSQKQREGRRDKEGCTLPGPAEKLEQEGWWRQEWVLARPHPSPTELGCSGDGGKCSHLIVG